MLFQAVINWFFAPVPPPPKSMADGLPKKRVAIIGAGLTGVSSAAHCVGHGFDVQIFESRSKEKGLGGIWSVRCDSSYMIPSEWCD
jgi:monoamine oxidase